MFNFFKNKQKRISKSLILNPNSKANPIGGVSYSQTKRALKEENLSLFISIYDYLSSTDTQISSEIFKRKSAPSSLPIITASEDKLQDQYLQSLVKSHSFRRFIFDCSSSIAYGFSAFTLEWEKRGELFYPAPKLIPHSYIQEENNELFITNSGEKIYLKDRDDVWGDFPSNR